MSGIPAGAGSLLGKRLGKYEILALLALGGTAEIYLARIGGSNGFEKYVVVKCLHDHLADDIEFVRMFLDEARLAAHLDHSNIVQTYELGEYENRYFMVMEFLAGLSLAMVIRRAGERLPGGRVPVPLALNIISQACSGLHYAHERANNGKQLNIVHRDISPQNLVVGFEGITKVVDFGIAKAEQRETHTRSGTIKGKFAYMSPEQCVANNVDRRTDVFALGVIIHELLTGRRLFKRASPYETYQAVMECHVPLPSSINHELDPALDAIVMRAVAKEKERRYPTAEALGDALQGYLHQRGKGSGPSDVARFFEQSFGQEIEEHGERMRELISGREPVAVEAVGWGGEEEERRDDGADDIDDGLDLGQSNDMTRDLSGGNHRVSAGHGAASGQRGVDLGPAGSGSALRSQEIDLDNARDESAEEDDMPADRTRIESNPLDLERFAAAGASPASAPRQGTVDRIARQPTMPAESLDPLQTPVLGPPGAPALPPPPSAARTRPAKFGEASSQPTMVASVDPAPSHGRAARSGRPDPAMELAAPGSEAARRANREHANANANDDDDHDTASPDGSTVISSILANPASDGGGGAPARAPAGNASVQVSPSMQHALVSPRPSAEQPKQGITATGPAVATPVAGPRAVVGAPGTPRRNANTPRPQLVQPELTATPVPAPPQPYAMDGSGMQPLPESPPVGAHPDATPPPELTPPPGYEPPAAYDPVVAASMMSPVGAQYPSTDWDAAAAVPAKAVPPWKLAVFFFAALALALALTIVIARIAR